jgi:hypothetical protein
VGWLSSLRRRKKKEGEVEQAKVNGDVEGEKEWYSGKSKTYSPRKLEPKKGKTMAATGPAAKVVKIGGWPAAGQLIFYV